MRVIAIKTMKTFWEKYPDAEQPLKSWFEEARNTQWTTPHDIKKHYRNASILKNNRVVFNIKGNTYRLVVAIAFQYSAMYIKFIGTHAQYDLIDATTIDRESL